MTAFFLDDTYALPLTAGLVVFALAISWHLQRTRRSAIALGVGIAIAVLLLLVQKIVITDREEIDRMVRRLAVAVETKNFEVVAQLIDEEFGNGGQQKTDFLAAIKATLTRVEIEGARLHAMAIDIAADDATVEFGVLCRLRFGGGFDRPSTSRWSLGLVRRDAGWRVREIRPLEIDRQKITGLDEVFRLGKLPWPTRAP